MTKSKARAEKLADYISNIMDTVVRSQCCCLNDSCTELSMQELRTIKFIGDNQECIMREISDHLMLAVSTLTAIIDKLVEKQFVTRYRLDDDRRIVKVKLTAKGKEMYKINRDNSIRHSESMIKQLNDEEQEMILHLLSKINSCCVIELNQKVKCNS